MKNVKVQASFKETRVGGVVHFQSMNPGSDCVLLSDISVLTRNQEVTSAYFSVC